ncbi:DUF6089 family protein [Arcicella aurantiaca]|uniref:DUF6089 family protein n=1 Tax=Arcicella aurantiaca TaxID=591202 RepID=UPI0013050270|nr:DUF6089 family protein [Arcicella aurantiaca]
MGIGSSHFSGDIGALNNIEAIRWNINCSYTYTLNPAIHLGIAASYIRLSGDDFYANNDLDFIRNLHFRNDLKQISTFLEYHPLDYTTDFRKRLNLSPYLLVGIGYYIHNPQAKLPVSFGNQQWINLEPYHTEGQGVNIIYPEPYKLSGITIPSGIGLRYRYNKVIDCSFEVTYHSIFTDYLDDVSSIYPNTGLFSNQIGVALSNRSREPIAANTGIDRNTNVIKYLNDNNLPNTNPFNSSHVAFGAIGTNRGSKNGNDAYITTSLKIQFLIPNKKIRCPQISNE